MRIRHHFLIAVLSAATLLAAACSKNETTPGTPTCTVSVGTPSATTFDAAGGTATAAVTAASGCAWTAVSNAAFVTIAQGASGNGNGTVQFSVAANTATTDRTGTLTIGGSNVTITQRGATAATAVTIAAPALRSPSGGETITGTRPTLSLTNAVTTGNAGTVTYRFEISDQSSFPSDAARTFVREGVAQGAGTTSAVIDRDLGPSVLWYWRARATNGTVTSAYSATETFRTPTVCSYTVSPTTASVGANGGTISVTVGAAAGCAWTATSNVPYITVASGASGTGDGTVSLSVGASGGVTRSGTVTIAGQTVTINQGAAGLVAGFRLIDNGAGPNATTECVIRSVTSTPSTCTLESTSFPLGTNGITNYSWLVEYNYPSPQVRRLDGPSASSIQFSALCGQGNSTDSGTQVELQVQLTVTDTDGNSVTVRSNAGGQPLLTLRTYICGI